VFVIQGGAADFALSASIGDVLASLLVSYSA
jgi:hypothetical protein